MTVDQNIPGKVQAAMDFVQRCNDVVNPISCCTEAKGRPLSPSEQSVFEAALGVLRLYFLGEMDFESPRAGGDNAPADAAKLGQGDAEDADL